MKTITLVSQKGGTGKTLIATNLAAMAALDGLVAVLIDTDPQGSAAAWAQDRGRLSPMSVPSQAEALPRILANAGGTDLAIVDTAPHTSRDALQAAQVADLVIVPTRPSLVDLRAIKPTLDLVGGNPLVVLNQCRARASAVRESRDALEQMGATVASVTLGERVAFEYGFIDGGSALEYEPNGKAALEMQHLYRLARKQVGL